MSSNPARQPTPAEARGRWWRTPFWVIGVQEHPPSWTDRAIATVIAGVGIGFVVWTSQVATPMGSMSLFLVGSIGASAVLVFAVPHGPLSQPWSVLGGHTVSAIVGVGVTLQFGGGAFAAALAVALAIGAMHVLRCIHPPGGATALAAVLLTSSGHPPEWGYVLAPVLLNAGALVLAAIVLNAPFRWRRYPLALADPHRRRQPGPTPTATAPVTRDELRRALAHLDSVVDLSDDDLERVCAALAGDAPPVPSAPGWPPPAAAPAPPPTPGPPPPLAPTPPAPEPGLVTTLISAPPPPPGRGRAAEGPPAGRR
jgi:CBS domain-containing membrane protein